MTTEILSPTTDALITELVARQGGAPDTVFCHVLGLSRSQWQAVRTGRVRLGLGSLGAVLRRYPDLAPLVTAYAASHARTPENASQVAEEAL